MTNGMTEAWAYCEEMLPLVSRTFSLNIQRLEGTLHRAVLVGYLLFRIADTLEDCEEMKEEEKIRLLTDLSELLSHSRLSATCLQERRLFREGLQKETPEMDLVWHGDRVFCCLESLPLPYRSAVVEALGECIEGMIAYQLRKQRSSAPIFQLRDDEDLIRYCYYVAGVVGKMLTELFCLERSVSPHREALVKEQVHFGIGLQMVNIVKDYTKDIARGWCYLPRSLTEWVGIEVEELRDNPTLKRGEIILQMTQKVLPHLEGAHRYIRALPLRQKKIRMFCIIPFVLAYHTLVHLLESGEEKLRRAQVETLLRACETFTISDDALTCDYEQVKARIRAVGS